MPISNKGCKANCIPCFSNVYGVLFVDVLLTILNDNAFVAVGNLLSLLMLKIPVAVLSVMATAKQLDFCKSLEVMVIYRVDFPVSPSLVFRTLLM